MRRLIRLGALIVACGGNVDGADGGIDASLDTVPDNTTHDVTSEPNPCGTNEVLCNGTCYPNDVNHCGPTCTMCGAPTLGSATCDGKMCGFTCTFLQCGTTCVDPSMDQNNCGACGHSCLGTPCNSGECQWQNIYSTEIPFALAIDSTNLYWSNQNGDLRSGPKGGGSVTTLTTLVGYLTYMTLYNATLYWTQ